jgi:hypothetical protein
MGMAPQPAGADHRAGFVCGPAGHCLARQLAYADTSCRGGESSSLAVMLSRAQGSIVGCRLAPYGARYPQRLAAFGSDIKQYCPHNKF